MALASPDRYRITVDKHEVLPDGALVNDMRQQFIGNAKGLQHLERLLDSIESSLSEQIKQQDDENKAQ